MTGNTKFEQLKGKLESVENKMDIEKSDEDLKKLRTVGFETLKNVFEENSHIPDKDFKELWEVGFRFLRKNLKEDPKYCEEVVSIFENYGEQKRKLIWRYVALLSIQINEIDPKNKSANKLLKEAVQFLEKMEKDEWKKYWDLVLRITKNVVSRDPKNESAKNLIIEAERVAKDEEEKMEKSYIDEAGRVEIEESLDDFPAIKRKNEKRIQKIKLSQGVRLSINGEWRWRGMKDHLELKKVGNYWLPSSFV